MEPVWTFCLDGGALRKEATTSGLQGTTQGHNPVAKDHPYSLGDTKPECGANSLLLLQGPLPSVFQVLPQFLGMLRPECTAQIQPNQGSAEQCYDRLLPLQPGITLLGSPHGSDASK